MTNLADLLPAGGGQNNTDFVADGNVSAGAPVILTAAGKAAPISSSSASLGSEYEFESGSTRYIASCFAAADDDVVVVVYQDDANSDYGTVVVGQIYGNGLISYGTPVVFNSAETKFMDVCWDSSTGSGGGGKVVITYSNLPSSSGYGTAAVGTLSGTSISMGAATAFYSGSTEYTSCDYDASADRILVAYRDASSGLVGKAISGEISGTSISFAGSSYTWSGSNLVSFIVVSYDTTAQKSVIMARDNSAGTGTSIVASVSGTTVSYGSLASFNTSAGANYCTAVYDSSGDKTLVFFSDATTTKGTASVGTVSGTEITWTTPVIFHNNDAAYMGAAYSSYANKTIIAYSDQSDSYKGKYNEVTLSGTSLSFGAQGTFESDSNCYHVSACPSVYGSVYKIGIFYQEGTGGAGTSVAIEPSTSTLTSTNLLGLAPSAISDTATGTINTWGSRCENSSFLGTGISLGATSTVEAVNPVDLRTNGLNIYDSTNNKHIIVYLDAGASNAGHGAVGTISGTTVSYGTPVVFQSQNLEYLGGAYDSTNEKVLVCYRGYDTGQNFYLYGVVGTVSGTSISWGTPAALNSTSSYMSTQGVQFDSNTGKFLVCYQDGGSSSNAAALVATVSGTSVSAGTPVSFDSTGSTTNHCVSYDANAQKFLVTWTRQSNYYAYAAVATISGTSVSFGSTLNWYSGSSYYQRVNYDANAQKHLSVYTLSNANGLAAAVGTISGTSVTYGSGTTFVADSIASSSPEQTYDSTAQKMLIFANVGNSSPEPMIQYEGTISGTSVTVSSGTTILSGNNYFIGQSTYNSSANKTLVLWELSGTSLDSAVGTLGDLDLTVTSDYYVQTDGSLSTDTGGQLIGKAIKTNQINIKDYTG
jgi:hypothetical protein